MKKGEFVLNTGFIPMSPRPAHNAVRETHRERKCKVLALNGSKDIQVVPQQNLEAIAIALKKSQSPGFETIELSGLNHLFQHCKACTTAEYGLLEETFSPEALDVIVKWLNKKVGNK